MKRLKLIIEELDYKIDWKTASSRPGSHKSKFAGSGFNFKTIDSILRHPEARRIDLSATIRNGTGIPEARIFEQKSSIKVIGVCDLSASLNFRGEKYKMQELANFVTCLAYSAYRVGDQFGLIGFSNKIDLYEPPAFSKGLALEAGTLIWNFKPKGKNSQALLQVTDYLPKQKSLIFLASDFHFDLKIVERFLSDNLNHEIIPIIFWDAAEFNFPKFGFINLFDPETQKEKLIFLRPGISKKIKEAVDKKRQKLLSILAKYGAEPLIFINKFNAVKFSKFFLERRVD